MIPPHQTTQPAVRTHTRNRGGLRALLAAHPITAFVVLAYALSWWLVPLVGDPLGSGPFLAGLAMAAMIDGRRGVSGLMRSMVQWRVGWRWWAAALLLPAAASLLSIVIAVALGAPNPIDEAREAWTLIPANFLAVLLIPAFGPWEEPGFRGFALSRLMQRRSPVLAGLVVGAIHVGWHTPLFFSGEIPASDVVLIMAAAVVFAWLVIESGGSVLMAMVMHAGSNAFSGDFASTLFTGTDVDLLGWVRAGLWCLIAVAVLFISRRKLLDIPENRSANAPDHRVEPTHTIPQDA